MGNNNFLLKDIKLVVCDFDGIFTDGKIEVFSDGKTSKKLDYKDIMGIAIVVKRGIKFAIISGENSAAIDIMKEKLSDKIIKVYLKKEVNTSFYFCVMISISFLVQKLGM